VRDGRTKEVWYWLRAMARGVWHMRILAGIIKAVKLLTTMRNSITLFHFQDEDIKIDIVARFDGDKLVIDGYDIGKRVGELMGDSDYEYIMTIPATSVASLYGLLDVEAGNRKKLLKALAKRFHGNKCFSAIGDFLDQNSIEHETFTWA
jgi:hypothetical protein